MFQAFVKVMASRVCHSFVDELIVIGEIDRDGYAHVQFIRFGAMINSPNESPQSQPNINLNTFHLIVRIYKPFVKWAMCYCSSPIWPFPTPPSLTAHSFEMNIYITHSRIYLSLWNTMCSHYKSAAVDEVLKHFQSVV